MKYQKKKFTLDPQNDAFRDNWDATFGEPEAPLNGADVEEYYLEKEKAETPVEESPPKCCPGGADANSSWRYCNC